MVQQIISMGKAVSFHLTQPENVVECFSNHCERLSMKTVKKSQLLMDLIRLNNQFLPSKKILGPHYCPSKALAPPAYPLIPFDSQSACRKPNWIMSKETGKLEIHRTRDINRQKHLKIFNCIHNEKDANEMDRALNSY